MCIRDRRRHLRGLLAVREALVRTRARYVSLIRTLLRREGLRVRGGNPAQFIERLTEVEVPALIAQEIEPLLKVLDCLDTRIALADRQLTELAGENDQIRRLCTVPGVGPAWQMCRCGGSAQEAGWNPLRDDA